MSSACPRSRDSLSADRRPLIAFIMLAVTLAIAAADAPAADEPGVRADAASSAESEVAESVLTDRQWDDLERAVDRGLEYLASQQAADGSFESAEYGQPAVTSLCVMAFLSRGHMPGEGPYGNQLSRAIEFVLSRQQPDGLLFGMDRYKNPGGLTGSYNHAIAGVMLGEVYGMSDTPQHDAIRKAIELALELSIKQQQRPVRWADDRGGWRYLRQKHTIDSDLSVTSWYLMFYRSARNAGFTVPDEPVDAAVDYVRRCYDARQGSFSYGLRGGPRTEFSRGMAGAGILSLSLAGQHRSEMARRAGDYLLRHPFDRFNQGAFTFRDRFFYGAYYCSQGMFQLGGRHWAEFYPVLMKTMLANQRSNGAWDPENMHREGELRSTYSTSLAILALTPPYQLLPIYQR